MNNRIIKWFIALSLVVGGISIFISLNKPVSDFGNYYYGSKFLREGIFDKNIYDCWTFNQMIETKGLYENYTPVPPFSAIFYVPFSSGSLEFAKLIFNIFSLLAFILAFVHAIRYFNISNSWVCAIPIIFLFPFYNNIIFGQGYLLLAALLMEGFIANERKQFWLAGICFTLSIHLKIFPAIILAFFLLGKKWKTFSYTIFFLVLFFGCSLLSIPYSVWQHYLIDILPRLMHNEINNPFATDYQSMYVFLEQLFLKDELLNPAGLFEKRIWLEILNGIYVFAIILPVILISWREDISDFKKFSLWIFAGIMISGYGTNYGLLLLIFPMIAFLFTSWRLNRNGFILMALCAIICFLPVHQFHVLPILLRFPRLWMMLTFYFVLIASLKITFNWKIAAALFTVIIGFTFFSNQNKDDGSKYFLDKEAALLIGDYKQEGDSLKLYTWSENGKREISIPFHGKLEPYSKGKDFVLTRDGIPVNGMNILNDSILLYLSDKGRGVGFYTLRKIPLKDYSKILNE